MNRVCTIISGLVVFFSLLSITEGALSLDDRISCEKAIQQVYWKHTLWQNDDNQAKPPLEKILPDAQIKEKVEGLMRKTNALAEYWQQPVTGAHLQAEMERMARNSKDPDLLRELWKALGNNPEKIAVCLAQPGYIEGLIHKRFAFDERMHGALKMKVQDDLLRHGTVAHMNLMSGTYHEIELNKNERKHDAKINSRPDAYVQWLSQVEWDQKLRDLSSAYKHSGSEHTRSPRLPYIISPPSPMNPQQSAELLTMIPENVISSIQETETKFYIIAVIEKQDNRIKLALMEWNKPNFDEWWATAKNNFSVQASIPEYEYTLPEITAGDCAYDTWEKTYTNPYAREWHTAVWTGSEMIIWGGFGQAYSDYPLATGIRYNPSTDTWRGISTVNAPTLRSGYTAIWAGNEMIIWGGYGCTDYSCTTVDYLNTGYRYNPANDSWRLTSTIGAPTPRESPYSVWTGSKMLIWGGDGFLDPVVGGKYAPSTDSWSPMSTSGAPYISYDYKVFWTGKEMIVWNNYGARYNPDKDKWTPMKSLEGYVGDGYAAVWTGTEMIVWGGDHCLPSPIEPCDWINGGARYNPVTDNWTPTSLVNTPNQISYPHAIWAGNRMIIYGSGFGFFIEYGGLYNPANNTWSSMNLPSFPVIIDESSIISTGTEMIVWGGYPGINAGARYKPSTNTWRPTSTAGLGNYVPYPSTWHTAVWTGTEMIEWGGYGWYGFFTDQGARYNPALDAYFPTSLLNAPAWRTNHTGVWTGTEMIIWGGYDGLSDLNSGGRYNPTINSWTATTLTGAPVARHLHTAVWANGDMVIWGGHDGTNELNSGGRYHSSTNTWAPISNSNAPSPRYLHTAIWTGNEMIVWGGRTTGYNFLNDGGRYNPSTDSWLATSLAGAPDGRAYHTAVWTGDEMIIWGGFGEVNTGGKYNPASDLWTPTTTTNAPSARQQHTAVWTGAEMIIWGGFGSNDFNTGSRYNPVTDSWNPTSEINAPEPRFSHTGLWTGKKMLIWGARWEGGLYCAPYPNFSITCSPTTVEMLPGSNAATTCTITSAYNFSQPVTLSCDDLPAGISCGFNPNPVTPPMNGTVTSTLTISAAANTVPGSYGLWVTADSSALSYRAPVHVNVLTPTNLRVGKVLVDVHSSSGSSNVNGMLEPGESVMLEPQWTNQGGSSVALNGAMTVSQVPPWAQVTLLQSTADYGTVAPGATTSCYDATSTCYELQLQTISQRTVLHSDITLLETLNDSSSHLWSVHIGVSFSDVPVTSLFYNYIEKLLHANVIAGCNATSYCPNLAVNREQVAKYLCSSMGTIIPGTCALTPCQGIFSDILLSNVFCPHIESLYEIGIISGCDEVPMRYCPGNSLRRQEAAKLICRSMDMVNPLSCLANPNPPCTGIFTDVTASNPFCPYIEALYNAGVLSGCTSSTFCPTSTATRGQIAKLLVNAFSL